MLGDSVAYSGDKKIKPRVYARIYAYPAGMGTGRLPTYGTFAQWCDPSALVENIFLPISPRLLYLSLSDLRSMQKPYDDQPQPHSPARLCPEPPTRATRQAG
jgi:hypothetical protein